jgi:hypothetical protein
MFNSDAAVFMGVSPHTFTWPGSGCAAGGFRQSSRTHQSHVNNACRSQHNGAYYMAHHSSGAAWWSDHMPKLHASVSQQSLDTDNLSHNHFSLCHRYQAYSRLKRYSSQCPVTFVGRPVYKVSKMHYRSLYNTSHHQHHQQHHHTFQQPLLASNSALASAISPPYQASLFNMCWQDRWHYTCGFNEQSPIHKCERAHPSHDHCGNVEQRQQATWIYNVCGVCAQTNKTEHVYPRSR